MRFLLKDLRMDQNVELFTRLFEKYVPTTTEDTVLVSVKVKGRKDGMQVERTYAKQFFPSNGFTTIEMTTAYSLCATVDLWASNKIKSTGLVRQENIEWEHFIQTPWGAIFKEDIE